ncbi:putative abc multidrug protein [Botrytis fragariae]|uniref:Putative abc multidrug protein n=1 Tax=Botrytis fragariae TaxID=1964551 RepID=A0A8H6AWL6_9HELO|nr:putative abc multidrug protein [Botrytis fragariae]KAF5875138.1 putative abc multidrug protein [Botrytis fragariae]
MDLYSNEGCQSDADNKFGPVMVACARSFDFTLLFEQAILSVVPSTIFLLLSPWRIWFLRLSSQKTKSSWMSIAKPIASVALISGQIALLVFYTQSITIRTRFSIPTTTLDLLAAVAIVPLSHLEQYRSVKPSTLISLYLAFSAGLDIPQARTLYNVPGQLHLAIVFSYSLAARITLLCLEAWDKRVFLMEQYQTLATEATSGIFSNSLFLWMNVLFKRGYNKVISFEDLGQIDSNLESAALHQKLQDSWKQRNHEAKMPLLRSLWKAHRWSILMPVLPRLCYSGFLFAQPFLIERAISYLSQPSDVLEEDIGYGLIGATACIYLGIAISNALYRHHIYRNVTMVRGSLVSLIYTKSLSIENQMDDPSSALTLMSTDVDRICQSVVMLHDLWSRPLELILGIVLLAFQIGWVCTMPLVVIFVSAILDSRVTLMIGGKVKIWSDAVQQRMSLTADILSSMKSVKMLGMTRPLRFLLQNERKKELTLQAKFRWSTVWLNTLGNMPPALAPAVTFIVYAIKARVTNSGPLNISQVFTSLALINLATTPASELITSFPFAASCLGCVERIQGHLRRQDRHEKRILNPKRNLLQENIKDGHDLSVSIACLSGICISVNNSEIPLLRELDLVSSQGSFTMILGPSGSGKSTLLRAILGETKYSGTISINSSRIAYCPQTAWLFVGTIRQNICGLEVDTFDEAWYRSVLHACVLDEMIFGLSNGDNTLVEGQSSGLSGGQKQRLNIARALYHRPQLILFDDVLSALDMKTEIQVMTRLFGRDGLISKLGATVIFVTHSTRWETIADNVITLDGSGNAAKHSKIPDLQAKVLPTEFDLHRSVDLNSSDNVDTGHIFDSISTGENLQALDSSNGRISETQALSEDHIVDISLRESDSRDYVYYFKSVRWPTILMLFLSATAQTICLYMSQAILNWWAADHGSNEEKWLPTYLILAIGNGVMYGCTAWIMFLKLVPESAANLHLILLDVVMNAPYSFFTKTDIGTILNRFSQDMTLIESQLPTGVMCTLMYCLWTIGSLCLISLGSAWMAITIPAVIITLICIQRVYLRTSRRLRAIELELRSPIYSHFMETLNGLSSIRVLGWQEQFTDSMIEKVDKSQVPYYLLYCAQRWLQLVLDLVVAALAIIVIALAIKLRKSTDPGSLGLSLNNVLSFNETLSFLLQYWTQLEVSLGAISRTRGFAHRTPSEHKPLSLITLPQDWPEHGTIEIRNLNASYTPSTLALNNITLSIHAGEKVGFCGRSGSGKSSLLSSLLRLLESSSGFITIDGIDLSNINHQTLRERLLTVPQDAFLIQQTIRYNLDPLAQYTDPQLIAALQKVHLWSLFSPLNGLNTIASSNFLSQGQKQLFGLARVILGASRREVKGGILLLDEATSNIDRETDEMMQKIIREVFRGYTILIVAHRLDSIMDSERIVVLERGRVVEVGSPEELLGREGAFAGLCGARGREREREG